MKILQIEEPLGKTDLLSTLIHAATNPTDRFRQLLRVKTFLRQVSL